MGEVIDSLTADIFEETGKGQAADQARLTQLYKTRNEIAVAENPVGEEEPVAELRDQGSTYGQIEDEILGWGEAGELVLQQFNGDETQLRGALAFLDDNPNMLDAYNATSSPQLRADILLIAAKGAKDAGYVPMELNQTPRAPSPSPTDVLSWKGRISEMGAFIGTPAFNTPEAQLEWRLLHERIHGGGPIVGQGGRTV